MKYRLTAAPLPANFSGTQQELMDAIIARLEISSDAAPFSSSETAPSGNAGPWFKNGTDLYVWDEDTSTYIPLDLSASYIPQIYAGATAPDPTVHPLWLQITDTTVVGLLVWDTGTSAWVSNELGLADGSIGSTELAVGAVTSQKTANLAVTPDKLGTSVSMSKWEVGARRTFARMNAAGTAIEWRPVQFVSEDITLVPYGAATVLHGLGVVPHEVSVSIVYSGALDWYGFTNGDEVDCTQVAATSPGVGNALTKTATEIKCYAPSNTSVVCPADGVLRNLEAGWFMRIRCTAP